MNIKGITRRWIMGTLGIALSVFVLFTIGLAFILKRYFYSTAEQLLMGHANEFSSQIQSDCFRSQKNFNERAILYAENFGNRDDIRVAVYDNTDKFLASSDGFMLDNKFADASIQPSNEKHEEKFKQYSNTKEHLICFSKNLYDSSGQYMGYAKYTASVSDIDKKIGASMILLFILTLAITLFILLMGIKFIKSIIRPVADISATAKLIAQGDFTIKIRKKYDDEIGELCDTINYMAQELGIAEKMKNDFISSVSHEIRTPLTAIKGWAETMQIGDDIDKSVLKKGLNIIGNETQRLSGIVEELLDFSRLQSGRLVMAMERLDILAELGEAVYIFKEKATSENKTFIYNEPKMLPPINGDKNRLKQVFINVIDNALKYTSENGGISVSVVEKENGILVSVTDNGCGIPKDDLPKVKEKFYKASNSQRGSGIGLAVADEIIQMHGGTLEIVSEEGFGTSVNIFIPFTENESKPQSERGQPV